MKGSGARSCLFEQVQCSRECQYSIKILYSVKVWLLSKPLIVGEFILNLQNQNNIHLIEYTDTTCDQASLIDQCF